MAGMGSTMSAAEREALVAKAEAATAARARLPKTASRGAGNAGIAGSPAEGGIYVLRNPQTQEIVRSGRTNNLNRRSVEHRYNPLTRPYDFEPVYRTDNYKAQRGLEQTVHDTYKPPLNKINPISPKNKKRPEYMGEARRFLEAIP